VLQVLSDLLKLCYRGFGKARRDKGNFAFNMAHLAMPAFLQRGG